MNDTHVCILWIAVLIFAIIMAMDILLIIKK